MSEQEDEKADQDAKDGGGAVDVTEADGVEVDEDDKEAAKEMMTAYEDRPTLVLPGSGKTITGTAVNDWIDDDGNPKYADDKDSPAAKAKEQQSENGDGAATNDDRADEAKAKDGTGSDEPSENNSSENNSSENNDAKKNTKSQRGGQSERAAAADENTEDKSPEELKKDAEAAVEENLEKDKAFNEEIIKATKEDRERQNS